jgi:phosphoadenosine phosphosulfate reductase
LIANNDRAISIFTLDTGRLFQETYDVFHKTVKVWHRHKTYFPETSAVEELQKKGPNSFMSRLKIEKSVVLFEKWRH